ncbi:THO complex subunit 4-like [Rhynchophorus ferrugineus]|uniref:THO complex subunit 4-like n=1 Tax=Rhynchophorus ferrugineus TaxID=354439 RepID=UPI003FCED28B
MENKMDMSLDDIIKSRRERGGRQDSGRFQSNRGQRRGGNSWRGTAGVPRGRGRGGRILGFRSRVGVNDVWKHDIFEGYGSRKVAAARAVVQGTMGSTILIVSNLNFVVSDDDMQMLFAEFGPLKSAAVRYDKTGRSLGTADIKFEHRNDAIKAMKQYNGVPLDGRPMNIQLVTNELTAPPRRFIAKRFGGSSRNRNFRSPRGAARGRLSRGLDRGGN